MGCRFPRKVSNQLNLGKVKGKEVIANFDGGEITSNAGIVLLAELDKKLKITKQFAECFQDYRNVSSINYSPHQLLAQRIYGIVLGYEDVNDHDKLRLDPALSIAIKKSCLIKPNQEKLAGKSTINRLEYCPATILNQSESRYHKIQYQPEKIKKTFIDIFIQ